METSSLAISNKSLVVSESILQARHLPTLSILLAAADWHHIIQNPGFTFVLYATISVGFGFAIAIPCILFSRLFDKIVDSALNVWASYPRANQVVLEAGKLRIEFGCTLEPVPWEFIAAFAASQRDAVERGFLGVFDKQWWWQKNETRESRGRRCYVGTRIVENGKVVVPPEFG